MRWFFLIVGGIATAAMLLISMRLNFLFGFALGQTPEKAWVFGCVSVVSDAWKGLGPVLIIALGRSKRWPSALCASFIWLVCFTYAISSALGVAIEDRSKRIGGREGIRDVYAQTQSEIGRVEAKRGGLRPHRVATELNAKIASLLEMPVLVNQRVRGTVASISEQCHRLDPRTVESCAEIAKLREELAVAIEEESLDHELSSLQTQANGLRERGATIAADPQAELLARLSNGWVRVGDVGQGLSLLVAIMIELVSAFGPAVLSTYAEATRGNSKKEKIPLGRVVDYLAERVVPADDGSGLAVDELYGDYAIWCDGCARFSLPIAEFISVFDQMRVKDGLRQIRKDKNRYLGIRLKRLKKRARRPAEV